MPDSNTIERSAPDEEIEIEIEMGECSFCDDATPQLELDDGNGVCESCLDSSVLCYGCDRRIADDDAWRSDYDEEFRCRSCHESHADRYYSQDDEPDDDEPGGIGVHPYGWTPDEFHFFGEGPLRMGFELEVSDGNKADGASHILNNNPSNVMYITWDGTVPQGFEVTTHPMSLDYAMSEFRWATITGLKRHGFVAWNNRSCGLHVHMTRSAFNGWRHLFCFIRFIFTNKDDMVAFAGRESDYAEFNMDKFIGGWFDYEKQGFARSTSLAKKLKDGGGGDVRKLAVNMSAGNPDTVELRFFRPSLNVKTVQAALQFCDALFHYTASVTTKDIVSNGALAFNSFRSWLKYNNDPRYEILRQRIDLRCGTLGEDI